ncbi:MAG TPA: hypothetical protein VMX13_02520 [Sedimentisphaerales bacterium]|nr:hypothetical protein [Sedimentisphaerales bacterium]
MEVWIPHPVRNDKGVAVSATAKPAWGGQAAGKRGDRRQSAYGGQVPAGNR